LVAVAAHNMDVNGRDYSITVRLTSTIGELKRYLGTQPAHNRSPVSLINNNLIRGCFPFTTL
jgi:hypothetical protein